MVCGVTQQAPNETDSGVHTVSLVVFPAMHHLQCLHRYVRAATEGKLVAAEVACVLAFVSWRCLASPTIPTFVVRVWC